jgi:hypothetical protein
MSWILRRLFWMASGAALASYASRWTRRTVARVAEHYKPAAIVRRVTRTTRHRLQAARQRWAPGPMHVGAGRPRPPVGASAGPAVQRGGDAAPNQALG